jgi:hypothetical protein
MKKYQSLFEDALTRTRDHGLRVPEVSYDPTRLLTAEFHKQFPYRVRDAVGYVEPSELILQCLSIHYRLQDAMQGMLNTEVFFTIGWVGLGDTGKAGKETTLFEFDDDWIAESLKRGHSGGPTAKLHAWLTLPSMEIIDLSIISSIATIHKMPEGLGGVIANHADELLNGVHYVPMLVGADFLRRTGLLSEFLVLH